MDQFFPKQLRRLAIFTAAYMVISGIYAQMTGNKEFVFYLVVLVIMAGLILLVHRRVQFPLVLLTCLSIWGLLHMMGGNDRPAREKRGSLQLLDRSRFGTVRSIDPRLRIRNRNLGVLGLPD